MARLSAGPGRATKLSAAVAFSAFFACCAFDDRPGPGDRVEVLGRAEADRDQLAVLGREVDQADRRLLAVGELRAAAGGSGTAGTPPGTSTPGAACCAGRAGRAAPATPERLLLPRLRTVACTKYGVDFSVAALEPPVARTPRSASSGAWSPSSRSTPTVFWSGFQDDLARSCRASSCDALGGELHALHDRAATCSSPDSTVELVAAVPRRRLDVRGACHRPRSACDDPDRASSNRPAPGQRSTRSSRRAAGSAVRRDTRATCTPVSSRAGAARSRHATWSSAIRSWLHRVALADRDGVVLEGVEVDGDAVRRTDLVLAPVAAADGAGVVEVDVPAVRRAARRRGRGPWATGRRCGSAAAPRP